MPKVSGLDPVESLPITSSLAMTMRLLVFSLLTKTRPVSLAHPAEDNAAANTTMQSGADNRRRMSTGDPLLLAKTIDPSVRLIQVAGQAVNAPTLPPGMRGGYS